MPDPMVVEWKSDGVEDLAGFLGAAADEAERLAGSLDKVQSLTKSAVASVPDTSAGGVGAVPGRGNGFIQGPHQRLGRIDAQMERARSEQNVSAQKDLEIAKFRAQKQIERANDEMSGKGGGLLDTLKGILGAVQQGKGLGQGGLGGITRVLGAVGEAGAGGGAVEGAAGGLAAITEVAGPLAIAGLAVGAAFKILELEVKTLIEVIRHAVDDLMSMASAKMVSGGSASEVSALEAFGVPRDQAAAFSASLRQQMMTPEGMVAGARLGVNSPGPRMSGITDEAGLAVSVLKQLRDLKGDPNEQLRLARLLHVENQLPGINMPSNAAFNRRMSVAQTAGSIAGDPQAAQAAADLTSNVGALGQAFGSLLTVLGKPLIGELAHITGGLADFIQRIAGFADKHQAFVGALEHMSMPILAVIDQLDALVTAFEALEQIPFVKKILQAAGLDPDAQQKADPVVDALKGLKGAVDKNTAALQQGTFGGGPLGRGALPASLRGREFQRAIERRALRLGAWTL